MLNICDEPSSPNEGACLRFAMNRSRQSRGVFKIYDERESPNKGGGVFMCLRYVVNRTRHMTARVQDIS